MEVLKSDSLSLKTVQESEGTETSRPMLVCPPYVKSPVTDSNVDDILEDLQSGLTDKNWEVRNQSLVELLKMIPDTKVDLQSKIAKEVIRLVTLNLADIVPYVRRNALDVILAFINFSNDPEFILKNVLLHGVDTSSADTNLSLNTIQEVPTLLKAVKERSNISHQLLVQMVTSLSKRMVQITHQKQVIASFLRIKNLIGESMFDHFLETYYPQVKRDFDVLCSVYDTDFYSDPSDQSDHQESKTNGEFDYEGNSDDDVIMKVYDEDGNEIKRSSSRRVTFGGEIVKIRTPDSDATVVTGAKDKLDTLDINTEITIQFSSDDSLDSNNESASVPTPEISEKSRPRSSHIPLPIRPALHKPKPSPFRGPVVETLNGSLKQKTDSEILNEIPTYEGESLTSSSDSSDRGKTVFVTNAALSMNDHEKAATLMNNTSTELMKMKINDRIVLENLFRKDDWRFYVSGLERLIQIMNQPQFGQYLLPPDAETTGISLICYLFNGLIETKNNRVITSSLKALRILCRVIDTSILALNLAAIVPIFCSYLNCDYDSSIQLEAVETLKTLMRDFSPQTVVDFLFTDQCFFAKSSKMRENTLLCLMYALLTFPSTEFNVNELAETLIKEAINEPKRRVRQALLDTLSILGQFIPRSQFKIDNVTEETLMFKRALRARLTRRQLPIISSSGLLLYAFQISPGTAFGTDIEWILAGGGSLSNNYNKSKAKFNYAHGDISPLQTQQSWNQNINAETDNSKDNIEFIEYPYYHSISRGNSEEILHTNGKANDLDRNNSFERYSADWTDSRYSSNYFEHLHQRYPSNLSDTSSYASSYASDQNFPRLNPGYESSLTNIIRPVSEDKLDKLPWSAKYKQSSKLPIRLEPSIKPIPIHYCYNTGGSLPILNDKKEKNYFTNFYQNQKSQDPQLSSDSDSKTRWSQNKEIVSKKLNSHTDNINNVANKFNIQPMENNNILKAIDFKRQPLPKKPRKQIKPQISRKFQKEKREENLDEKHEEKQENKEEAQTKKSEEEQEDPEDKITDLPSEEQNQNSSKDLNNGMFVNEKSKKFLERKAGVKLKRSLTKEIKMPQNTFSVNLDQLPPFENPKEAINKVLVQLQSNEWETVIEALQGVVTLIKHHSKYLSPCLHTFVIAVAKEVRNLRSQVARAACLSAEKIFRSFSKISNQEIEELSQALFLRTADTNKFLREDSNKALDAMVENIKFSKCAALLTQKITTHPNALVRATTARLMAKMIKQHGPSKILTLPKDKRDAVLNTAVRFISDGNGETRAWGKDILIMLNQDKRMLSTLSEIVPNNVMMIINKLIRSVRK